jgi:hypothetical protein
MAWVFRCELFHRSDRAVYRDGKFMSRSIKSPEEVKVVGKADKTGTKLLFI